MKKNYLKIFDLIALLVSLFVFVLAETKAIELFYPWHMALCYGIGVIGIIHLVYSAFDKKLINFGFGAVCALIFAIYLVFSVLEIESIALKIALVAIAIIILVLLKQLLSIRSAFVGDNKVSGYKNYKERKEENK